MATLSSQKQFENKNLSFSENLQIFRNYVVDRSNAKEPVDKIYQRHLAEISHPEFKKALQEYHAKFDKGFMKSSRTENLAKALTNLYTIQLKDLSNETPEFASRILKDRAPSIKDEAKNLLAGSTFFSVDLAIREIRKVRIENNQLRALNAKLNSAFRNLAENVKVKFGLKEKEIDVMINTELGKHQNIDKSIPKEKGRAGEKKADNNLSI